MRPFLPPHRRRSRRFTFFSQPRPFTSKKKKKKTSSHDYSTAVICKGQLTPFTKAERIVRAATRASPAWGPTLSEVRNSFAPFFRFRVVFFLSFFLSFFRAQNSLFPSFFPSKLKLRTVSLLCEAPSTAVEVSGVLARRLDPPAQAWRRASKALAVVEHLVTSGGPGSARVAFATATLLDGLAARFQAHDEQTGRDVGEGVRTAAARLVALMRDPTALEEARAVSRMVRERARGSGGSGFGGGGGGNFPQLPAPERVLALPAPEVVAAPAAPAAAATAAADHAHVSPTPTPPPPPPQPQTQTQTQAAPLSDLLSFGDDDAFAPPPPPSSSSASTSASPATVLSQAAEEAEPSTSSPTDLPADFAAPAAIITAPPVFTWHPVKKAPSAAGPKKPATPAEALEEMLRSSVETFDGQAAAVGNGGIMFGGGDGRRTPPRPPPMHSAVPI